MKLLCSVLLALVALAAATVEEPRYYDLSEAKQLFGQFEKDYNRQYKDDADRQVHYETFKKSLEIINDANKLHSGATFGINKFTDYTSEDLKNFFGFILIPSKLSSTDAVAPEIEA